MIRIRYNCPEKPPEFWNALTPDQAWNYLRVRVLAEKDETDRVEAALQEETQAAAHWRAVANERNGR